MNKRVRLIEIYHGEFHNYDLEHTQDNLQLSLFIRGELKTIVIVLIFEKHIIFSVVLSSPLADIDFTSGNDNS